MGDGSPPDDDPPYGDEHLSDGTPSNGSPPNGSLSEGEALPDQASPAEPSPDDPQSAPAESEGDGGLGLLDELLVGLAIAGVLAVVLFALSGVWPPMVAVQSGSMEPNLYRGDMVFVAEEHRYSSGAAVRGTGVVPARVGERAGYSSFGAPGDVIVFYPGGRDRAPPIIHRAQFWVNDSENWYAKANPEYVDGDSCGAIPNCPAPHAGFVTKGDNNGGYDQVEGISGPVRPAWIEGSAEYKVPYLGRVRLALGWLDADRPATVASIQATSGSTDPDPGRIDPAARATVVGHRDVVGAQSSTTSTNATSIEAVRSS